MWPLWARGAGESQCRRGPKQRRALGYGRSCTPPRRACLPARASASWRALELTKLALRLHRPATTTFDVAAQALLFESDDKRERMRAFWTVPGAERTSIRTNRPKSQDWGRSALG